MALSQHKTTARILDILELVCSEHEGVSFSDISRNLDIPKSSLHPLIMTLCQRKYLKFIKNEQKYHIGENLFVLGNKYIDSVDILDEIKKVLADISSVVLETVYLGVLSGSDVLYLAKSESNNSNIRLVSLIGYKMAAYGVGFGKALLSQFSLEELKQIYPNGIKPITSHTVSNVEKLYEQCEIVRKTGFAYEVEESTEYVRCIAIPIICQGRYLAGVSVAIPVFRFDENKKNLVENELKKAKIKIETIINYNINKWYYS